MRYYLERCPHSIVFATSLNDLYNNHKVNFDGVNIGAGDTRHTSLDWFLAPTDRPSIDKAPLKEHYIDIPGTNGGLDLTESLTGFPLYDYIEGEIEFDILNERKLPILNNNFELINEKEISWEILNRDIRSFLNGKERYMMLEDDPSWYYKGRFGVEKYDSSDDSHSKITIKYKVYPYKRLSTCIFNNKDKLRIFFDTISLVENDESELVTTFWDKTDLKMMPGDSYSWNGAIRNKLSGGEEASTISISTDKESEAFVLTATYTADGETFTEIVDTESGSNTKKIRKFVLTNRTHKGVLYSDNTLSISLAFPELFDATKSYKKGDYVYYLTEVVGQTAIKWLLRAKNDITPSTTTPGFNQAEWDLDTDTMDVKLFVENEPYSKDDLVAYCVNNTYTMCIALNNTEGSSTPTGDDWSMDVSSLTDNDIYKPYTVSVQYDIGVM